jgi:hypothetical protein
MSASLNVVWGVGLCGNYTAMKIHTNFMYFLGILGFICRVWCHTAGKIASINRSLIVDLATINPQLHFRLALFRG